VEKREAGADQEAEADRAMGAAGAGKQAADMPARKRAAARGWPVQVPFVAASKQAFRRQLALKTPGLKAKPEILKYSLHPPVHERIIEFGYIFEIDTGQVFY
jgi:hypothetical protein